jgi:hypothetical protein
MDAADQTMLLKAAQPKSRLRFVFALLITVSLSLVLALTAGEVIVRALGYEPIYRVYSKPDLFWVYDPILGWAFQPNSKGVYVGPRPWPIEFSAHVSINSLGLRGPEVAPLPADGYRILVMGDSVVAAMEVDYQDTFVALLERQLSMRLGKPVQAINAGVRGYGTDQSFLFYQQRLRKLRPNMVVFVHSFNDTQDNVELHRMRRPFGKAVLIPEPNGRLKLANSPVPRYPFCSAFRLSSKLTLDRVDTFKERALCAVESRLSDHSALFTLASLQISQNAALLQRMYQHAVHDGHVDEEARFAFEHTSRIIREFAGAVQADDARFILVIPAESALQKMNLAGAPIKAIITWPAELGDRLDLVWKHDGHFNQAGHRAVATFMSDRLAKLVF